MVTADLDDGPIIEQEMLRGRRNRFLSLFTYGYRMRSPAHALRRLAPTRYLWPVLFLLSSCFGCLFALFFVVTTTQDRLQQNQEARGIESGFVQASELVRHDLQDYAKWDDAVRHIVHHFDRSWIDDNVTAYLGRTQGYAALFVLGPDDRTLYSFGDGKRLAIGAQKLLGPSFNDAIGAVRRMPRDGNPILSGYSRANGKIYAFAVAAIVPLTDKVSLSPDPTKLLVIAARVDDKFLTRIATQNNLPRLSLNLTRAQQVTHAAAIPLRDNNRNMLGLIEWTPEQPGRVLRKEMMPGSLLIIALALIASGFILLEGGRTIKALRQSKETAHHQATHDSLTGVANRRALVDYIRETIAKGEQVTLLYMDLDGFKDANDVYGHAAGDQLLREAATRITGVMRGTDTLTARSGGDEFALALQGVTEPVVEKIAARIQEAFQEPFTVGDYSVTIGVSMGLVISDLVNCDDDELMRRADVAMYAAKAEGKNCWRRYTASMDHDHDLRKLMEDDLRRAVERGEIEIAYQPIVHAISGRTVSVEALARWSHPVHGDVSPDIFIPLAEMSGLIGALGKAVLTRACETARNWNISLAVNLSPAQFWDRNIVQEISDILDHTGFPPEQLELEITESYLLRRPDAAAAIIAQLRALGIRIALDDFGTGFASIGYLRRMSFDRIKIDKSFIQAIGASPNAAELVAAIVALGRALHLGITAEGVETQEQADIAKLVGCDRIQGWLFGRPMNSAAIPAYLEDKDRYTYWTGTAQ
jgi:diguanylate cyclase (GGDEF)-like protein